MSFVVARMNFWKFSAWIRARGEIAAGDLRQLGDALHQVGDFLAEQVADVVGRNVRVFDHVVQQAGDDGRLIHLEVGQQTRDGDGMREVRVAGMAQLLAVLHHGVDVGLVELVLARVRLIGLYAIDEFVLTQEFAAARLCGGRGRRRFGFLEGGDVGPDCPIKLAS